MKIKNTAIALITTISLFTGHLLAQKSNYSELIAKKADKIEQKVIDWRHDIHKNPELGNREIPDSGTRYEAFTIAGHRNHH